MVRGFHLTANTCEAPKIHCFGLDFIPLSRRLERHQDLVLDLRVRPGIEGLDCVFEVLDSQPSNKELVAEEVGHSSLQVIIVDWPETQLPSCEQVSLFPSLLVWDSVYRG